jgi:hypothetical protein
VSSVSYLIADPAKGRAAWTTTVCSAHEALNAVLSDDHTAQAGEAALREIVARVALVEGSAGLQDLAVELTLKVAELTERIAVAHGLAAVDLADILFLD